MFLDYEFGSSDHGGEADRERGVSSGADDDLRFELAEDFVGFEGGLDQAEREFEERGEAEEWPGR